MIHYAKLDKSDRLQRIVKYLKKRGRKGATTREIALECDVMNVATCASEINRQLAKGGIDCHFERTTDDGRKVYRYRWV